MEGNPVNAVDPSGQSVCYDRLPAPCQLGLAYVNEFSSKIRELVVSGAVQPVIATSFEEQAVERLFRMIAEHVGRIVLLRGCFATNPTYFFKRLFSI